MRIPLPCRRHSPRSSAPPPLSIPNDQLSQLSQTPPHRRGQIHTSAPAQFPVDIIQPLNQIPHLSARIRPSRGFAKMRAASKRPPLIGPAPPSLQQRTGPILRCLHPLPSRCPHRYRGHQRLSPRQKRCPSRQLEMAALRPPRAVPFHWPLRQFSINLPHPIEERLTPLRC
jgi:hypothetical protein